MRDWIDSAPSELRSEAKMAMDVWAAGDEAALSEVCSCIEPLLFSYLMSETHDPQLTQELLRKTLLRMKFGACVHGTDVVGWALAIANRLAAASRGPRKGSTE